MPKSTLSLIAFSLLTASSLTYSAQQKEYTPENTILLFDVDDVLLVFPEGAIKKFLWNHAWDIIKNIPLSAKVYRLYKSGASGIEYADLFAKYGATKLANDVEQMNFGKMLMPGMQEQLQQLHNAGYQLDIATNKPEKDFLYYSQIKYPQLFKLFTNIKTIKKNTTKNPVKKPDPEYFKEYLTEFPSSKKRLFFDDKKANVDGAKKVGINGFVFTDAEQFEKDLATVAYAPHKKHLVVG